ncbi:hypothetical protein [Rhodobacter ferrooxidans]|uniref:DUF3329 domain-containing protein n=1 Tax=Rhodobacter ferrooxidans TaxID=371731 RepID=C8RZT9_9RHOB|nr:hypothetical protein [Rhodobacter sp. SW2]EEW25886.1 conserved hypothetical protein [Rhodobacter sp. SW2]
MPLIEPNHPFFKPVWRRWATGLVPIIWAGFELVWLGNPIWALIFAGFGAYALWVLVFNRPADS